ncbi:MAG: hypothetical protein V4760_01035 [Bdellovibrionota bacterium]
MFSSLKLISTLGLALLTALPALAAEKSPSQHLAEAWNHHLYFPFLSQLSRVPRVEARSEQERASCDRFYSSVNTRGQMKIVMGIGYYDFSEGEPFSFDYRDGLGLKRHDFGMNATMDVTYDILYRQLLTRGCSGELRLCGFKETSAGVYSKKVKTPEGRKIAATIEIKNSSMTPEHQLNVGSLKAQQDAKSAATTQWFFDSVSTADLVVYNGHSRKGGGPDFHAPKLRSDLHVDYDWYTRKTPGLNRLLTALQGPKRPAAVLMMSCNSVKLFEDKMARTAPDVAFAGTNAIIPGDIPNKGAMAGMDAFLKFQCEEGFARQMQLQSDMREQLKTPRFR